MSYPYQLAFLCVAGSIVTNQSGHSRHSANDWTYHNYSITARIIIDARRERHGPGVQASRPQRRQPISPQVAQIFAVPQNLELFTSFPPPCVNCSAVVQSGQEIACFVNYSASAPGSGAALQRSIVTRKTCDKHTNLSAGRDDGTSRGGKSACSRSHSSMTSLVPRPPLSWLLTTDAAALESSKDALQIHVRYRPVWVAYVNVSMAH